MARDMGLGLRPSLSLPCGPHLLSTPFRNPTRPLNPGSNRPPMPIRVLAAVIQQNDRLLVCQRPFHKRHGGLWEFPGGKVKDGESDLEAARRELLEELDVHVTEVGSVERSVKDPGSDFVIEFLPVTIQGDPRCLEHEALAWKWEEELLDLELAPSDRRYVEGRIDRGEVG